MGEAVIAFLILSSLITAPLQGCVPLSSLTAPLTWSTSGDLFVGQFHDPLSGCLPTTFEYFLLLALTETTATFDPVKILNECGRFQLDFETDEPGSLVSLVVDTARDCLTVDATGGHVETPQPPLPTPEPGTLILLGTGLALRRWWRG